MKKRKVHVRKKKKKKINLLIVVAVFVIFLGISLLGYKGYTYSIERHSEMKTNDFSIGDLKVQVVEEFTPVTETTIDKPYTKKVTAKNNGELPAFVRILAFPEVLSKEDDDGVNVSLPARIGTEILLLDSSDNPIADTADWVDGEDGYYYYLKALLPGETTAPLFEKVKLSDHVKDYVDNWYEGASLTIDVRAESIHTTQWAYRDAWWQGQTPANGKLLLVENALKGSAHGL
ncbi:hypothetical protein I6N95_17535 [Vagococcus sp. BWB3-3]|uniref:Alternate signal-mediated exported protein n=1 Tax=Vagococcus allomyrinae TaxID=2794353 RepID=A0A940ST75_9ENTE|nr:hypothetical protein [Vagococcus allomyrinae]MBP1042822.1 hypothetical protein [Vagococcus allomyrinae]